MPLLTRAKVCCPPDLPLQVSSKTGAALHYKGVPFHRILPGGLYGGDVCSRDGRGVDSIFGGRFDDEAFVFSHERGALSMAHGDVPDRNGCQFMVCLKPAPAQDSTHVVFGRVVTGLRVGDDEQGCLTVLSSRRCHLCVPLLLLTFHAVPGWYD